MKRGFVGTMLVAAPALCAGGAAAQVSVVAGAGQLGAGNLQYLRASGDTSAAFHQGGRALTLGVQVRSPIRWVDLRLSAQTSAPVADLYSYRRDQSARTSASVRTLQVDAIAHLPRVLDARPYLLAGAGVRRTAIDNPILDTTEVRVLPVFNAGAGVEWSVGRYDLFAEYRHSFYSTSRMPSRPGVGGSMGTAAYTFGLRIPIHR